MKLFKAIGVFLAALSTLTLFACSGKNGVNFDFKEDENTSDGYIFSSIAVDSANARKTFYIGEEFSPEGLKVVANYRKMVDGVWQSKAAEITSYSLDSSAFDSTVIGAYDILIGYREGDIISNTKYTVNVLPSIYDSLSVGQEYISGVVASFVDSGLIQKNGSFIREQYVQDGYRFAKDKLEYKKIVNKVLANNQVETKEEAIMFVELADSNFAFNIDYNKVGSYPIKITYKGNDLTIDGKTYENKVTTFVILNVVNPVSKIEKVSTGDTNFETSVSPADLSKWQFKITRHVASSQDEIVSYTPDLFKISGLSLFVASDQNVLVEYLGDYTGNSRPSVTVPVKVTESSKLRIYIFNDLSKYYVDGQQITSNLDSTNNIELSNGEGLLFADKIKAANANKPFDNLTFSTKVTIQAVTKNSSLKFVMPSAAKIVIYISSTGSGDLERPFVIRDEAGEEILSGTTTQYNTPSDKFEFSVSKAGTYTLTAPGKDIYVFGVIIAIEA